jgi:hypothetical protein
MKRIVAILLTLITIIGLMVPTIVFAGDNTCVTVDTQINVGNLPADGVIGGTNHGFCELGKENEWHFIINGLDPKANYPTSVTAKFQTAGIVTVPWIKTEGNDTNGTAHYALTNLYLTDKLVDAWAILPANTCYTNFNLSHAPCTTTTTTTITTTTDQTVTTEGISDPPEVGGNIYPTDKFGLLAPWIVSGIVIVAVISLMICHRKTES